MNKSATSSTLETKEMQFDQLSNDMYWKTYCFDTDCFKSMGITGYDDNYWWDSVASKKEVTCDCGKKYELDPFSNTITLLSND